jgi:hypothetical protein
MSPHHTRFLILEQGIGSALFNLALNAGIAWVMFRHLTAVPFWGQESIAGDTLGTCFFLPFFTALIVTPLVRRRIRRGRLAALGWTRESHRWLTWLPAGTLQRAAVLGAWSLVLVGPLTLLALALASVGELALAPFIAFKAVFAAALALLVTPVISIWALAVPAASPA